MTYILDPFQEIVGFGVWPPMEINWNRFYPNFRGGSIYSGDPVTSTANNTTAPHYNQVSETFAWFGVEDGFQVFRNGDYQFLPVWLPETVNLGLATTSYTPGNKTNLIPGKYEVWYTLRNTVSGTKYALGSSENNAFSSAVFGNSTFNSTGPILSGTFPPNILGNFDGQTLYNRWLANGGKEFISVITSNSHGSPFQILNNVQYEIFVEILWKANLNNAPLTTIQQQYPVAFNEFNLDRSKSAYNLGSYGVLVGVNSFPISWTI